MPEYSLVTLFLVGLMGGGHCLGMCGGLVTALSLQLPPARSRAPFVLAYNLGRVASYVLVGAIVGGLGGLGLTPAAFWALTPAELALMLGVEPGKAAVMTRDRLAELVARYPDRPAP